MKENPNLHYCTTARLHDCTTARLHDCTTIYTNTALAHLVESAVIESNITEKPQSSASPAPQNIRSALFSWICSIPLPMQCDPVEHADEIE